MHLKNNYIAIDDKLQLHFYLNAKDKNICIFAALLLYLSKNYSTSCANTHVYCIKILLFGSSHNDQRAKLHCSIRKNNYILYVVFCCLFHLQSFVISQYSCVYRAKQKPNY